MDSFRFFSNEGYGGLSEVEGVCSCAEDGVHFEFQHDIGGLGIKTGVKSVTVPFAELAECRLKKGWFRSKVVIESKGLKALDGLPGCKGNEVIFGVRRRERGRADYVIAEIDQRRAHASLMQA